MSILTRLLVCLGAIAALVLPTTAPAAAGQPADASGAEHPVVFIGASGLSLSDISPESTPHLWKFAERADMANVTVRSVVSVTCPAAGWLAVGSGARMHAVNISPHVTGEQAAAEADGTLSSEDEERAAEERRSACPDLRTPEGTGADVTVENFDRIVAANAQNSYSSGIGQLADTARESGVCVEAIGPGAAWAAADETGRIDTWEPAGTRPGSSVRAQQADTAGTGLCPLTLIDAGTIGSERWTADAPAGEHDEQLAAIDEHIGEYLAGLDLKTTTVHIAGVGDLGNPSRLRALLRSTPQVATGDASPGILESSSTRKPVLQLTDLTGLLLAAAPGIDSELAPNPAQLTRIDAGAPAAERIDSLVGDATAAATVHRSAQTFSIVVTTAFYVLTVAVGLLLLVPLQRWWARRAGIAQPVLAGKIRTGLGWAGLILGTVPMGSFIAALLPWERMADPVLGLGLAIAAGSALLLATGFAGPWRRTFAGRVAAICTVTAVLLGVDVALFGSQLQYNSLMGYNAIVAGRFYGLGNQGAALFIVALFLALAFGARALAARTDRRGPLLLFLAGLGAIAVGTLGNPVWGAKFGGTVATLSGLMVLIALSLRARLSLLRLAGIGAVSLGAILGVAALDYLRAPAARSHFGNFFAQLLSGGAFEVISRKLSANLNIIVVNPGMAIIVPLAALVILIFLAYLRRFAATAPLTRRFDGVLPEALDDRCVHAGFLAVCTGLLVGLVITDSGVAVPGTGAMMFVPFLLALSADVPVRRTPGTPVTVPEAMPGSVPEAAAGRDETGGASVVEEGR